MPEFLAETYTPRFAPGTPAPGPGELAQVAEQLYVSVYTVEAHLSQAYAKLGIGSRTQLARALSPRG